MPRVLVFQLSGDRTRRSLTRLSLIAAGAMAIFARSSEHDNYMAFFFGYMAYQSYAHAAGLSGRGGGFRGPRLNEAACRRSAQPQPQDRDPGRKQSSPAASRSSSARPPALARPLEIFAADGHGRSYGVPSRVLGAGCRAFSVRLVGALAQPHAGCRPPPC